MFDWKVNIKATNAIFLGDKTEEEGRPFKARFLQAGLVKYDFGVCLLKKETIDRFVNTFIDCPVIINHKDDIKKDDKQGTIKSIWFAPEDGWFWCSGVLDEEAAKKVEKDGFNVSCQYRITEYSNNTENKLHNGNPYDKEILNGVFEHLAIVKTPRYEDAYIAVNAIMATNEDQWITIGADDETGRKGKHIHVKEGQTKEEAIKEKFQEWASKDKKQGKLFDTDKYYDKDYYNKQKEKEEEFGKKIKEVQEKEKTDKENKKQEEIKALKDDAKKMDYDNFYEKYKDKFEKLGYNKFFGGLEIWKEAHPDLDYFDIAAETYKDKKQEKGEKKEETKKEKINRYNELQKKLSEIGEEARKKVFGDTYYKGKLTEEQHKKLEEEANKLGYDKLWKEYSDLSKELNQKDTSDKKEGEEGKKVKLPSHQKLRTMDKEELIKEYLIDKDSLDPEDDLKFYKQFHQGTLIDKIYKKYEASNSFLDSFKNFVYDRLTEEINDCLGELTASNEDKWITIHPHGKSEDGENDYRRLLTKEGETVEEAMHRQGYYDKRKVNDELKKKVEEKIKTLEEKAKKVGGDQTVLGRKYLAEAEALRKGLTGGEEKKPEDKKPENKQSLLPQYASDFIDKTKKQKEAREKYHKLLAEYQEKAKTDAKMLEFERQKEEIFRKMDQIKTYNQEFQQLINEKNKVIDAKRAYEKEFFKEVYAAQKEYSDLNTIGDKKDIINKMSNDIKAQISKISEKHNDLVKSINKIDFSEFEKLKKQDKDFEKEQNEIYEKMREIGREVGYNDPRISEYRALYQEYAVKRGKIKKQRKELQYKKALEVGKLLQVKNGVKLDTKNSPAMQDITDKLKECLDGVIPSTNFNNAKMTVKKHEGRAYQSGSTINISANEEIGTAIHETMHHLEEHSEHVLMNSLAFATSRTVGDKQESLKRLTGLGYKANEVCKKDKFFNPYCGKLYDVFGGRDKNFVASYASEIMSMGVQELFTNPQEFAKNDREYFDFVVANLKGELWS